jgi:hypothetical protein
MPLFAFASAQSFQFFSKILHNPVIGIDQDQGGDPDTSLPTRRLLSMRLRQHPPSPTS